MVKFLKYLYDRSATSGTVGYFSCTPQDAPDFRQTFALLQERPLDTFLHEYALDLLQKLPESELDRVADAPDHILAALLAEVLFLAPKDSHLKLRQRLDRTSVSLAHTPLPLLAVSEKDWLEKDELSRICRDNLERLAPLPLELFLPHPASDRPRDFIRLAQTALKNAPDLEDALPPRKDFWRETEERLNKAGLAAFPEMRHEASLSPIALLREWPLAFSTALPSCAHTVAGKATAYGRGLSLAQARTSLRMEIAERASAHASILENGQIAGLRQPAALIRASAAALERAGEKFYAPFPPSLAQKYRETPFYWLACLSAGNEQWLAPCQAIFLFCNLDEPAVFEMAGSTGLGAGQTDSQAKLAALLEIVERDAHASTPYIPEKCFRIASRDPMLNDLLLDYAARRIYPVFQDITTELGVPAFRCVVRGLDGEPAQGICAKLSGKKAALAALTETPWPYSWATPAPFGKPTQRPDESMPVRFLEDLPDYEPPSMEAALRLLETTLALAGYSPLYFNLTRTDLGLPVFRAFVPGLETHAEFDVIHPPSKRFMANAAKCLYKNTE